MPAQVSAKAPDRRQRKSRAALHQALLTLLDSKPYDAITIDDVTETADVARATFYAHYKDKATLTREVNRELVTELTRRVGELAPRGRPVYTGAAVSEIFRFAREHETLFRLIISGGAGSEPRDEVIATFQMTGRRIFDAMSKQLGQKARSSPTLATTAFVGALLLTLERWLDGALKGSPDAMARDLLEQQLRGLEWSLGFDPGVLVFSPPADAAATSAHTSRRP